MKDNIFKGLIAAAGAAVGAYCGELLAPVLVLVLVMVLDYATGMADAWAAGELSSGTGLRGIVKKLGCFVAVGVAVVVDWIIETAAGSAGAELGSFYAFGLLVTIWLILNECISILENLSRLGVPLPAFLRRIVEKLKNNAEAGGEHEAD